VRIHHVPTVLLLGSAVVVLLVAAAWLTLVLIVWTG
jgi:hypothetical protein